MNMQSNSVCNGEISLRIPTKLRLYQVFRMTNLALLVETSALSWGKLGEEQGRDSLADVFRAVVGI